MKAVEAVIRTQRTAESGLVYETRAEDQVAAAVQDYFERSLADFQKQRAENEGLSRSEARKSWAASSSRSDMP